MTPIDQLIRFPGFSRGSVDMQAVRDQRRSPPLYIDVDLSVARSVAAGTDLKLPIAGNFLYVDQRQNTGFASIHFQDQSPGAVPITLFAGALWKVPFTQVSIENLAQAGTTMRLIYGMDIDALPISAAGVTVLNAININDLVNPTCQIILTSGAVVFGAAVITTWLAATLAANPNGATIRNLFSSIVAGAGGSITSQIIAASAAPAAVPVPSQANAINLLYNSNNTTGIVLAQPQNVMQRRIPAGWGIFLIDQANVANASRSSSASIELL